MRKIKSVSGSELRNMDLIGKYVRTGQEWGVTKIYGRVTIIRDIIDEGIIGRDSVIIFDTTHRTGMNADGELYEDRYGKFIGDLYGKRIYLEKEWRKSCKTCAYKCKRNKRCEYHSDNSVGGN